MKRFVLSLLILVGCLSGFSQKIYFLYLQSENDQPFFVKLNEKIHSSTASGYLILSRLHDSSYTFTIGFPLNKYPEQKFMVDMKGKDRGYLLKNFGDKGWGLFDLQTLAIQMALPDTRSGIKMELRTDLSPFTEILARAANDPSLRERPVAVKMEDKTVVPESAVLKEVVKPTTEPSTSKLDSAATANKNEQLKTKKVQETVVPPATKPDSAAVVKKNEQPKTKKEQETVVPPVAKPDSQSVAKRDESITKPTEQAPVEKTVQQPVTIIPPKEEEVKKKEEVKASPEYKRSVVTKKSESSTSEGLGLVFIDELADGKKDTIRIMIPNPPKPVQPKETGKDDKKFLDISASDTSKQVATDIKSTVATSAVKNKITNTNCKTVASESDLSKLQKKMIGEKNDEDMVGEARKVFKSRCFTTAQLKSISTLFMNDAGKYKFFDASYSYVSDTENFSSLSSELKDEYYINRFKAMLR